MDDKHSHIDDWMRKAAARQPAPDDSSQELKRQAWSKMAALLDEDEEEAKPQPRLFRFRLNWAAIIIPFVASAAVFAATMWVLPSFHNETPPAGKSSAAKERYHRQKDKDPQQALLDSASIDINKRDTLTSIAGGTAALPGNQDVSVKPAPGLPVRGLNNGTTAENANNHASTAGTDNIAAGNVSGINKAKGNVNGQTVLQAGLAALKVTGGKAAPAPGKGKSSTHNKVNKAADKGTTGDNETLAAEQTGTDVRNGVMQSGRIKDIKQSAAAPDASIAILHPVRTRNVFALQLPSLSGSAYDHLVPLGLSGRLTSLSASDSRWALQAGLLSPLSSALGIRLGILYVYPLGNSWYLQPQLSASYLTGYEKTFSHLAINKHRNDSSGSSGTTAYTVDTLTTPYTFKRAFAGSAGINVGYSRNRMSMSTGLVYSMAMASGKQDSTRKRSNVVLDSLGQVSPSTDPAFSTGRLPGAHQLSWNFDISWYVMPRLQAGFNYRVVLWRSKGDKGFQAPLQKIQDNSLFEVYIRIPLGR